MMIILVLSVDAPLTTDIVDDENESARHVVLSRGVINHTDSYDIFKHRDTYIMICIYSSIIIYIYIYSYNHDIYIFKHRDTYIHTS